MFSVRNSIVLLHFRKNKCLEHFQSTDFFNQKLLKSRHTYLCSLYIKISIFCCETSKMFLTLWITNMTPNKILIFKCTRSLRVF